MSTGAHEQLVTRAIIVPCPDCGVPVNNLCLTNSGRISRYPHRKRMAAANRAQRNEEARRP